jgi:hypothetical protein
VDGMDLLLDEATDLSDMNPISITDMTMITVK